MAEYIDIDKAIVVIDTRGREIETTVRHILDFNKGVYEADDVQSVRHGRWIEDSDPGQEIGTAWRCSSCGLTIGMKKVEKDWHRYCLNCGAKMDGGINDGV